MVLFPMYDTWQRCFFDQLFKGNHDPRCAEADVFRSVAYTQHGHPFARDERMLAEGFETVVPAVVPGYHTQAGGTAVHGVELGEFWKRRLHYNQGIFYLKSM